MPSLALQVSARVFFAYSKGLVRFVLESTRSLPQTVALKPETPFGSLHFAALNPFSLTDVALDHFHSGGRGKSEKLVCKL
jgi:hypothetical protein